MSEKRHLGDADPDYEDYSQSSRQTKRLKLMENDGKEQTVSKIHAIVRSQFQEEIESKREEIFEADQRIVECREALDRLRACIVATYYSKAGVLTSQGSVKDHLPSIHPATKKYLGKTVPASVKCEVTPTQQDKEEKVDPRVLKIEADTGPTKQTCQQKPKSPGKSRASRFKEKKRIIVGNVSRYIPLDKRDENDQATHKWMVYVRGPKEAPHIRDYVHKIWFFLHPSYRPNDLVEVSEPPFHLTRRGWGEFPVRVQLHFKNQRNKRVDILHPLKLDRTYTGLQTLGSETVVEIEVEPDEDTDVPHSLPLLSSPENPGSQSLDFLAHIDEGITIPHLASPPKPLVSTSPNSRSVSNASRTPERRESQSSGFVDSSPASVSSTREQRLSQDSMSLCSTRELSQDSMSLPSTPESGRGSEVCIWDTRGTAKNPENPERKCSKNAAQGKSLIGSAMETGPKVQDRQKKGGNTGFTSCSSGTKTDQSDQQRRSVSSQSVFGLSGGKSQNSAAAMATNPSEPVKYVKCVDNKGRTILIPKNLLPQLELKSKVAEPDNNNSTTTVASPKTGKASQNITKPQVILQPQESRSRSGVPLLASPEPVIVNKPVASTSPIIISPRLTKRTNSQSAMSSHKNVIVENAPRGQSASRSQSILVSTGTKGSSTPVPRPLSTATQSLLIPTLSKGSNTLTPNLLKASSTPTQNLHLLSSSSKASSTTPQNILMANLSKNTPSLPQNVLLGAMSKGSQSLLLSTVSKGSSSLVSSTKVSSSQNLPAQSSASASVSPQQPFLIRTPSGQLHLVQGLTRPNLPQQLGQVSHRAPAPKNTTSFNLTASANQTKATGAKSLLKQESSSSTLQGTKVHKFTPTVREILEAKRSEPIRSGISLLRHISPPAVRAKTSPANQGKVANPVRLPVPLSLIVRCETPKAPSGHVTRPANQAMVQLVPQEGAKSGASMILPQPLILSPGRSGAAIPAIQPQAVLLTEQRPDENVKQSTVSLLKGTLVTAGEKVKSEGQKTIENLQQENQKVEKTFRLIGGLRNQEKTVNQGVNSSSSSTKMNLQELLEKQKEQKGPRQPKLPNYRLSDFLDFEDLLRTLVRHFPLVATHPDRSMHPYCATSRQEFLGWKVGKRRAAELMRVVAIRRKAQVLLQQEEGRRDEMELWDRYRMIVWCRHHGYTPLDKEISHGLCDGAATPFSSDTHYSSSSPAGHLVERLGQASRAGTQASDTQASGTRASGSDSMGSGNTDSTHVDVVGEEEVDVDTTTPHDAGSSPLKRAGFSVDYLPVSPEAEFVHDQCSKIGVRLKPLDLRLECEKTDRVERASVYGSVVEEILWQSSQRFVEELLRSSLSVIFRQNRLPEEISADHVYQAITSRPECDFLTNTCMGREQTDTDS